MSFELHISGLLIGVAIGISGDIATGELRPRQAVLIDEGMSGDHVLRALIPVAAEDVHVAILRLRIEQGERA